MDTEHDSEADLMNTAVFGRQAEDFLHSDIGQYLTTCAEEEIALNVGQLKTISPGDVVGIQTLQAHIKALEFLNQWLRAAVSAGLQALDYLEENRNGQN